MLSVTAEVPQLSAPAGTSGPTGSKQHGFYNPRLKPYFSDCSKGTSVWAAAQQHLCPAPRGALPTSSSIAALFLTAVIKIGTTEHFHLGLAAEKAAGKFSFGFHLNAWNHRDRTSSDWNVWYFLNRELISILLLEETVSRARLKAELLIQRLYWDFMAEIINCHSSLREWRQFSNETPRKRNLNSSTDQLKK